MNHELNIDIYDLTCQKNAPPGAGRIKSAAPGEREVDLYKSTCRRSSVRLEFEMTEIGQNEGDFYFRTFCLPPAQT